MAELNQADIDRLQSAIEAMLSGDARTKEAPAAQLADIKTFFCKYWETVKKVLEFIAGKIGEPVASVIRGLIAIGDTAHKLIC